MDSFSAASGTSVVALPGGGRYTLTGANSAAAEATATLGSGFSSLLGDDFTVLASPTEGGGPGEGVGVAQGSFLMRV